MVTSPAECGAAAGPGRPTAGLKEVQKCEYIDVDNKLGSAELETLRREPHVSRPVPYCDVAGVRGGTQPLELDAVGRGLDSR